MEKDPGWIWAPKFCVLRNKINVKDVLNAIIANIIIVAIAIVIVIINMIITIIVIITRIIIIVTIFIFLSLSIISSFSLSVSLPPPFSSSSLLSSSLFCSGFQQGVTDPPLLTTHSCYIPTASSCSILRVITFFLIFIVTAIFVLSRFPTRCSRPTFIDDSSLLCSDSLFLFHPQSHYLLPYLHRHRYLCFIQVSNKVFLTHLY